MNIASHSSRAAALAFAVLCFGAVLALSCHGARADGAATAKPTVVLVHGAFDDSSSWDGVIKKLQVDGYQIVDAANPLRSLSGDADYIAHIVDAITGPVVLVGHSYGGSVITDAGTGKGNVKALVYVAALAPMNGESALDLVGKFPGSILGKALARPVALSGGAHDISVRTDGFGPALAADVPLDRVRLLAAPQRPVTDTALKQPSSVPAWKTISSWFIYGDADRSIPPAAHAFMAHRAGAKETIIVKGASHDIMISHPIRVARLIEDAAISASR